MYRNLFLTFVISGLWHGAAWTFVIWGALHGVMSLLTRAAERSTWYHDRLPKIFKLAIVFAFVCLTWIFFRAESLADAWLIVTRIFATGYTAGLENPALPVLAFSLIAGEWAYQFLYESRVRGILQTSFVRVALVAGMILYLLSVPGGVEQPFIYFQF